MSQEDMLAKLLEQLLEAEENKEATSEDKPPDEENDIFGGIDIQAVMRLGEIMSQMNKDDDSTRLLLALKPHLRPENQRKADSALRLMKIMNILPLLKSSGMLDGLF